MDQPSKEQNFWRKCSSCKREIAFNAKYFICSVSTCQHKRTGFVFCSVPCWDAHLGFARHRSAYVEDALAPSREEARREEEAQSKAPEGPQRRIITQPPPAAPSQPTNASTLPHTDTLVVVSKVKQLIREQSEMNTSQCAIDALTELVVKECLEAIKRARDSERKTVMGRDIGRKL